MNILRISCSPRGHEGDSHKLSEKIIRSLSAMGETTLLMERLIGLDPVTHIDRTYLLPDHADALKAETSITRSEALIRELDSADVLVLATPMHNLGMPSVLKAWIDHIVRAGRTFQVTPQGKLGNIRDRPVFVAISSGSRFSGPQARQPDFLTAHLTAVLGTIGLRDVTFFSIQGTALGAEALSQSWADAERTILEHFSAHALGTAQG